eukprot:TRINITY_DN6328_c0_g2_i1.p1 TRINITY_DN6328_c0_g2~~TRINITY_DN6328_c0_g2_i1.p1  ORF type:complete len:948 (-),score=139.19 TRINITY_DN6328_c0_g2_i1:55-2874(-)
MAATGPSGVETADEDEALAEETQQTIKLVNATKKNKKCADRDLILSYVQDQSDQQAAFLELPFSITYFIVFTLFVLVREDFLKSGLMQRQQRQMLGGTTFEGVQFTSGHKDIGDIDTVVDVWTWLHDVVVDLYVARYGPTDPYRVLRHNQLVGGVLLQQVRRKRFNCSTSYPDSGPFVDGKNPLYSNFECYPWTSEADACFGPVSGGSVDPKSVLEGTTGWCTDKNRQLEKVNVKYCGYAKTATDLVNDTSCPSCTQKDCYTLAQCVVKCNLCDSCVAVRFHPEVQADGDSIKCQMLSSLTVSSFIKSDDRNDVIYAVNQRHGDCEARRLLEQDTVGTDEARRLSDAKEQARLQLLDTAAVSRNSDISRRMPFVIDGGGSGGGHYGARQNSIVEESSYSTYLTSFEGQGRAFDKIRYMSENNWIDYATAWVGVRMFLYNPNCKTYCYVIVNIFMPPSGRMLPKINAFSFPPDMWPSPGVIITDILWVIGFIIETGRVALGIRKSLKRNGLRETVLRGWLWIDIVFVCCGFVIVFLCWGLMNELAAVNKLATDVRLVDPNRVTPGGGINIGDTINDYEGAMESIHMRLFQMSDYLMRFRLILSMYTLLVAWKVLRACTGQPRLAMVTNTLTRASTDIVHFLIVLITILGAFIVSGMYLFGNRLWSFSQFGLSLITCSRMLLGDFDFDELREEELLMPMIWFVLFIVLVVCLMLNMLMAIIMDQYTEVKSEAESTAPVWTQISEAVRDGYGRLSLKKASWSNVKEVLESLPEGDVNEEMLEQDQVYLSREQANFIIQEARKREDQEIESGITLSAAMRTVGWLRIAVEKMRTHVEEIELSNKEEHAELLATATPEDILEAVGVPSMNVEDFGKEAKSREDDAREAPSAQACLERFNRIGLRMSKMDDWMRDAAAYINLHGNSVRNRLAVIEDLARARRDGR